MRKREREYIAKYRRSKGAAKAMYELARAVLFLNRMIAPIPNYPAGRFPQGGIVGLGDLPDGEYIINPHNRT